jgi:hypothetical protein
MKYTLRLHDKYDRCWVDVIGAINVDKEVAEEIYNKETKNGTQFTKFEDGIYFKIFPADTKMLYESEI